MAVDIDQHHVGFIWDCDNAMKETMRISRMVSPNSPNCQDKSAKYKWKGGLKYEEIRL